MTLSELSEEYKHSAQLIKNRMASLRKELRTATDPDVIWNLKRRIAELTPILTQTNEIADLTAHYYERGHYRNERYSSNCFRDGSTGGSLSKRIAEANNCERTDGGPAGYVSGVLCPGPVNGRNRKRTGYPQEYRAANPRSRGKKDLSVCEVPETDSDEIDIEKIIDAFLDGKK